MADGYGMPRVDFGTLGDLGKVYKDAQNERTLAELGQGLTNGTIDYKQAAGLAARAGRLDLGLQLLQRADTKEADAEYDARQGFKPPLALANLGQPPQQSPTNAPTLKPYTVGAITSGAIPPGANHQPTQQPGMMPSYNGEPPRAKVQSTPGAYGDDEAIAAGIYEQPAQVAQAQQPPQQTVTPPVPRTAVQPTSGNVQQMMRDATNQNLSPARREVAKLMLDRALKENDDPDIKKYNLAVRQGEKANFTDWYRENKRALAPPAGEKEYDKTAGKNLAEINFEIIKGAGSARAKINTLTRLGQLLDAPGVYTGTGGTFVASLKRAAASLGIDTGDIKDGTANADAIQSIVNQFALELRNPAGGAGMPGALSDSDRKFLSSMPPGFEKTPEGNRLVLDYMIKINQRLVEVDRIRQSYVRKNGRIDEAFFTHLADWSDANPLFPQQAATTSAPATQQAPPGGKTKTGVGWSIGP